MNFDELETRLRNIPRTPIPAAWRKEILGTLFAGDSCNSSLQRKAWWKQWLWPHPTAWATLAAVWVAILALHFASLSGPEHPTAALIRPAPEMLQAFHDRTRLMAELSEEPSPAPPAPGAVDRPRSSRRAKEIIV